MDVYAKMKELGITLPNPPAKGGLYTPAKEFGKGLVYVSGCGPAIDGPITGKLGKDFTAEEGERLARNCMLNVLAVLQAQIGDLNRVKTAVKILTFVASTDDFTLQPAVANGGSQLIIDLFGKAAARSAIGVNVLPGDMPVESEVLFELKEEETV